MDAEAIPDEVCRFLTGQVRSVMALELLLLLWRDPQRAWTAAEFNRELRSSGEWAEGELDLLARQGLVEPLEGQPRRFRRGPTTPEATAALDWLGASYPQRRFSIIQAIYAAPLDPLQSFADAFRLRKEDPRG